jgi:myo-inositol-1(or 4)-monophosphatase
MINFIKRIAAEAGRMTLDEFKKLGKDDIQFKNEKDIVTAADKNVERFIISQIRAKYPEDDIHGEETGRSGKGSDHCWIIDPIDGTTSYVHEQPFYSVSIALAFKNRPVLAAVYAPRLGELFYAERGKGAFLNGRKISVSGRDSLGSSVLSTGFACIRAGLADNNLKYFSRIVPAIRGVRRFGSAAIDMAYVAAGRLEGFWEMNLNIYDIAAGILLVEEAGGKVSDFSGGPDYPKKGTVATNGKINEELLKLLAP